MKQALKFSAVLFVIVHFLFWSWFLGLFQRNRVKMRKFRVRSAQRHSRVISEVIGLEIQTENFEKVYGPGRFIVANHLSYLDTIALMAMRPLCFVTSVEMRESFPLGWITQMAGCLFVERRSRENILGEIDEIGQALRSGFSVVVFPEATSGNGEGVLPFKKALFTAAIKNKTPVVPLVLQYKSVDDTPITLANRDEICWHGDMEFIPHFLRLLRRKHIQLQVSALQPIAVHAETHRDEVAALAREQIVSRYKPIV